MFVHPRIVIWHKRLSLAKFVEVHVHICINRLSFAGYRYALVIHRISARIFPYY